MRLRLYDGRAEGPMHRDRLSNYYPTTSETGELAIGSIYFATAGLAGMGWNEEASKGISIVTGRRALGRSGSVCGEGLISRQASPLQAGDQWLACIAGVEPRQHLQCRPQHGMHGTRNAWGKRRRYREACSSGEGVPNGDDAQQQDQVAAGREADVSNQRCIKSW
jgi:hypothetical protein